MTEKATVDQIPAELPAPAWFREIKQAYRDGSASIFIVHGNIADYVEHPDRDLPARDFVSVAMAATFTVVNYSVDEGIHFIGPEAVTKLFRREFLRVMELAPPEPDEMERAIRQSTGGDQAAALPSTPSAAIPLLCDFLRRADPDDEAPDARSACVVIDRLDLIAAPCDKGIVPDGKLATLSLLHRIGSDYNVDSQGNLLIMFSPSLEEIHPDLRQSSSKIRFVEIPPPDHDERLRFIERLTTEKGVTSDLPLENLAAQTAGLYRFNLEDIILQAGYNKAPISKELVRERKKLAFKVEYADVLEVLDNDVTLDMVGGLDEAITYLQRRMLRPMSDPALWKYCPMAGLLMGPAGTGKTLLANAIGNAAGINVVLLRAENIKDMYVGQSEKKLAKALAGIISLAPCIVFIDEVDQRFKRTRGNAGDGGSAVESNIFGRILEFVGDTTHRGRIVVLGAANHPADMDPALKRAGRFGDLKLPILPPRREDLRRDVLLTQLRRHGVDFDLEHEDDYAALVQVSKETDGWTQAELEALVLESDQAHGLDDLPIGEALIRTCRSLRPGTAEVMEMAREAINETTAIDLVPEEWRRVFGVLTAEQAGSPSDREYRGRGGSKRANL